MQERRSSLQVPFSTSRKRPQPTPDNAGVQGDFGVSDVKHTPENDDFQGPSRARTFPHGLLGRANKRNSMPSSVINPTYNLSDTNLVPVSPQVPIGYGTPSSTASGPTSALFPQQLGDPNIPDLRAVMFPSDNPFAYPNQPMSTLEGTQYMSPEEQQDNFSAGTSEHDYHITNQMNTHIPPDLSFNDLNNSVYTNNLGQDYHQNGHFSAPMGATNYPVTSMEGAMGMSAMSDPQEGFWAQMNKQGIRTGMTPSAVNLDELFGGESWSNVWSEQNFSRPL